MVVATRQGLLRVWLPIALTQLPSRPSLAAALSRDAALTALVRDLNTLERVNGLLDDRKTWPEAASLVSGPAFEPTTLTATFDAYTQGLTATETLMCANLNNRSLSSLSMTLMSALLCRRNNAAFIVYYEERRYGDTRLEPKEPGLRALQNGAKKDTLRAIDDLRAEFRYTLADASRQEEPDELRAYCSSARAALKQYLSLADSGEVAAARSALSPPPHLRVGWDRGD